MDLDHICGVFVFDRLPSCVEEGAASTLTDTGRTLAVTSLGERRSVAFRLLTDCPVAELAEGATTVLPRVYGAWVVPRPT